MVVLAGELAEATHSWVDKVAWVTQVHGSQVHAVQSEEKAFGLGTDLLHLGEADALVSASSGVALCVLTADCAPLALASAEGVFGAVHAGWRGLHAGVVEAAVDRMRGWGATEIVGFLGPCIHVECYEFSQQDLDTVGEVYGDGVRGRTSDSRPALDMSAGIAAALERSGARMAPGVDACTACGDGYFSHRARRDLGRQALLVWSTSQTTKQ